MFSYNNIVEKGEPSEKATIEHALDACTAPPPQASQSKPNESVDCIVVENFLSDSECDLLVEACEKVGYSFWHQHEHAEADGEAKSDGAVKAVRVVDTIEADFPLLSKTLYERIAAVVDLQPKTFTKDMDNSEALFERDIEGTWLPYALSTNLLFGRYKPGGHFMPHIDGSTIQDLNTRSFYTLLIYLNECPDGGETFIFSGEQCHVMYLDESDHKYRGNSSNRVGAVHPKKGSAAFFYYDLLHEGAPVRAGLKYICRADLLYRRTPPILDTDGDRKAFELYQQARLLESSGDAMKACELFQKVSKLSKGVAALYQLD